MVGQELSQEFVGAVNFSEGDSTAAVLDVQLFAGGQ
jgi:hypothetical protein